MVTARDHLEWAQAFFRAAALPPGVIAALDDIRRELLSNNFVALNVRSLK